MSAFFFQASERNAAPRFWVIVAGAGNGSRMGGGLPKQYLPLAGKTVLEQTLTRLAAPPRIAGIVIALAADDAHWATLKLQLDIPLRQVIGGGARCHSVLAALDSLLEAADPRDWVLVHDAARPCVRAADLERLMDALSDDAVGGLLAVRAHDTLKRADSTGHVADTLDRAELWHAQTPQMFRLGALHAALNAAIGAGELVSDEAAAMERAGAMPRLIEGHGDNIKITRPDDLILAETYLRAQAEE